MEIIQTTKNFYSLLISCAICLFTFYFVDLSEAVDVYGDWIDACESAN